MRKFLLLLLASLAISGCATTRTSKTDSHLPLALAPLPEVKVLDSTTDREPVAAEPISVAVPRFFLPEAASTEGDLLRELYRFQRNRLFFKSTHRVWPTGLDDYWCSFLEYVRQSLTRMKVSLATLHRLRISIEAEYQFAGNMYGVPTLTLIKAETGAMELIRKQIAANKKQQASENGFLVLHWPLEHLRISSFYGTRVDPFTGVERFHRGIDLAATSGTVVYAAAAGVVTRSGWFRGHGKSVTIKHNGGYFTVYSHMSAIFVAAGQQVESGSTVGLVGSTGRSTGPHLHFEVKHYNTNLDPLDIIEVPKSIGF